MKKYYYQFILYIVFGLSFTTAFADEPFGTEIGRFNNIPAYSNCSSDCVPCNSNCTIRHYINGDVYIGIQWQCVEYVRRYYYEIYNLDLASLHRDDANTFYNNAATMNLDSFANGGTEPPAIGDIIVSEGEPHGHVAIVRSATENEVCTIQQNFSNDDNDDNRCLNLTVTNGHYNVAGFSPGYPIQGWLRRPCTDTPSDKSLARIEGQDPVYWIQNSIKYYVTSPDVLTDMSGIPGWDHVCDFSPGTLDSFQNGIDGNGTDFIGTSPNSNGLLIKQVDNPNVYLVENGQKKWITSTQVFEELGYDWNDVVTVSEAIMNQIPEGGPIYSGYGNWIKGYTNGYDLEGEAFIRTSDGGFLVVGNLWAGTEEGAFVLKLDEFGTIDSPKKRYADVNSYRFYSALEVSINEYLIAGTHIYMNVGNQGLILKIDSNGNILGEKEYPGISAVQDIKKTTDGSYIILGYRSNCMPRPDCGFYGHVLIKLNADLSPDWRFAIDGPTGYIKAGPIIEMSDGYIFAAGNKIVKVFTNGEQAWQKSYDIENPLISVNSVDSIYPSLDGRFLVAGKIIDNYNDLKILVFKINGNGDSSGAKSFNYNDGQRNQVLVNSVIELPNQDILVLAENTYTGSPRQISLLRLFPNGSFKWNKEFGYFDERYTTPKQFLGDEDNYLYILGKIRKESFRDDTLLFKLGQSGIVNNDCDFVTDIQLAEQDLELVDIETSDAIDLTKYESIDTEEIQPFQSVMRMYPICQGSALHDQTIAQLPFGLVPEMPIFDAINPLASLIYKNLFIGIKALQQIIFNWPGSEMKLEVFKPDGTLYGEYQDTTPPISVDIPNPEEGLWTYNVIALDVPNDEYPFSLVVGITKYQGDFNSDGDVDGGDLVELISSGGLSTELFAENFGNAIQE